MKPTTLHTLNIKKELVDEFAKKYGNLERELWDKIIHGIETEDTTYEEVKPKELPEPKND